MRCPFSAFSSRPTRTAVVALLLAIVSAGCARIVRPPAVTPEYSGFFDDYSRLRLGDPGDLYLVYRNPKASWAGYDKVLVEPVTLWRSGRDTLAPIPEDDLLRLVAHFEGALRGRLGKGFRLVTEPSPGTLRLRLAITEARAADKVVDVLTATPEDGVSGATGPLGPELAKFIDAAAIEGEIRDAVSGEIVAQGIDRRRSGAPPPLATWEGLDRTLAFWADRACARLEARTKH